MRDFKFRVWDSKNGMQHLTREETDYALLFRSTQHFDGVLTIMQYTGKIDKNNKEIYEGDIVEYLNSETDCIVTGEVEFDFGQWAVRCLETDVEWNLYGISQKVVKVVGNIYEGKSPNEAE